MKPTLDYGSAPAPIRRFSRLAIISTAALVFAPPLTQLVEYPGYYVTDVVTLATLSACACAYARCGSRNLRGRGLLIAGGAIGLLWLYVAIDTVVHFRGKPGRKAHTFDVPPNTSPLNRL